MSSSARVDLSPRTLATPAKNKRKCSKATTGIEKSSDRLKRSSALIEEQVLLLKDLQNTIENIMKDLEQNTLSKEKEEHLQALLSKSQELLVMLQVIMKIRNELAHARIDLEIAVKSNSGVELSKKRVKWLQQRLEKLLSSTKSYCYLNLAKPSRYLEKSDISEKVWDMLTDSQRERYFHHQDTHHGYTADSVNVMDDFSKMILKSDPKDTLVREQDLVISSEKQSGLEEEEMKKEDQPTVLQKQFHESETKKRKTKKEVTLRTDGSFPVPLPNTDLYEGGDDSSPEPLSDSENDDAQTPSIVSSVGPRPATQAHQVIQTVTKDSNLQPEKNEQYWSTDHHRFEWCDYMLQLDPSSWHALGIAVQDSFLSKEKHKFDSSIPWKEKPMKVNSVIDVHKIALDKLLLRLHRIYEAIGKVTQATIDPLPKNEKLETVMGKQEGLTTPSDRKPNTSSTIGTDTTRPNVSRDLVLPPLREAPPKSLTLISMSPDAKDGYKKSYPRHSKEWCDDIKSGHNMPRLVNFKPPSIYKKTSNIQSRYLGPKPDDQDKKQGFSLFKKNEWKPAAVKRLLGAMKVFDSSETTRDSETITVEEGTPRWRRLMDLLGESGLKSSNPTIAMEAAKTIGQLNCRHPDVLKALKQTMLDQSKEPRVLYEASKALILLGTWSPQAMEVIIEHIKKGNELVVKELLEIMTKAKNIPFVDKSTPEFRSLVYLLIELVKVDYHPLSFRAAISLGRLCVIEPVSKVYLIDKLASLTAEEKSEALLILIKQVNCHEKYVIEMLLDHLCTAHNWKNRLEAAELLIFIGPRSLFNALTPEQVFDVLERLLWDHSNKELRAKIAEVINVLGMKLTASSLIMRRLDDPNEEVRAQAVISLATLGMKGGREMKALLDILELDSSVYVRIQVIRAFSHLKWNDPRIIRSLRERDRGDSTLATEARKTVAKLTEEDR